MFRVCFVAIVSLCVPLRVYASESPKTLPTAALSDSPEQNPINNRKQGDIVEQSNQMLVRLDESNEDDSLSTVQIGVPPEILTSNAPPSQPERAEGAADLGWLQGLVLPDIPVRWDDRVVNILDYYRSNPQGQSHIRAWFRRMATYGQMIRSKLKKASLPEDLVYVAMVESGFDPTAKSEAGALGMWQFVEATGEDYGLERSPWVEQRRNPERSTDAAIRFFKDLYSRFGSWELSIAAFNMGYGALIRTIQKYNSNDFWLLSRLEAGLPYETVAYVATVMSCAVIGRNPERFGIADLDLSPTVDVSFVSVPGGIGLAKLARAASLSTEDLAALNPELRKSRIPPDVREWTIRIPASSRAKFIQKLEKMQLQSDSHDSYVMRFGEQLADVARMFDTTTSALRRLNNLNEDQSIGPGFQLLVPAVKPNKRGQAESPTVVAVPEESFIYTDRRRVFYRVTGQDSIDEISRFFKVSTDELCRWNKITKEALLPRGLILQLFVPKDIDLSKAVVLTPDEVKIMAVGSDEFFAYHEAQRDRVRIRYRVLPSDTLPKIAERFGLSVGSIARINRFSAQTALQVDQEIIVYVPKELAKFDQSK
jgi:membrane-bound lytic murein transglycosylase D